ncbi:hypothetical protein [Aquimarina longa]|uniref:hypothetical protein n=1 Tax=Aquimarina longa TaxID=1080221 RepID=UPI0007802788|nr:hypothetical protein [Aquimarina longa]
MTKKRYFVILLTALALLVVMQQQAVVPNQEIVLEFANTEVTSLEAQNTIAIVKKQLQSIGVTNTRISKELKDGKLKITYYSDADVAYIKRALSKERNIAFDHVFYDQNKKDNQENQFPVDKNSKEYKLDVYEIQKSADFSSDFNDKYVLEVRHEKNGYSSTNSYSLITKVDTTNINKLVKVAQKINKNIAIAIDNTSHNIPEVRAGPIS